MPLASPPEKMMFQLSLRRRGISDQAVLRAMDAVPRDLFVLPELREEAWRDTALPIACGQTISQPFVVAYMTEQLSSDPSIACSRSGPDPVTRPRCWPGCVGRC